MVWCLVKHRDNFAFTFYLLFWQSVLKMQGMLKHVCIKNFDLPWSFVLHVQCNSYSSSKGQMEGQTVRSLDGREMTIVVAATQ